MRFFLLVLGIALFLLGSLWNDGEFLKKGKINAGTWLIGGGLVLWAMSIYAR